MSTAPAVPADITRWGVPRGENRDSPLLGQAKASLLRSIETFKEFPRSKAGTPGTAPAVLFDLDGTLLDTAPDLAYTLNQLRKEYQLPALPFATVRPLISLGSREMIKHTFNIAENHPDFLILRERFLTLYQTHLADTTQLFPNIEKVLAYLEHHKIPWGIVTNKLTRHTLALLKALYLDKKPHCVICGDSLPQYKPAPEPILYACQLLKYEPKCCLYIGDSVSDVVASKAAGTKSLVALYGYISEKDDPFSWQADGYIHQPLDIMTWLENPEPCE